MKGSKLMRDNLRQMIAVLQAERQALAGLDLDAIMGAANEKVALCGTLDAARRMNEVNRQVRNLIAANVSARLDALTGSPALYRAGGAGASPYYYAGVRA